jgi:hypothetical protein
MVVDDVFTAPCDTSVLYPITGGSMHQFTAIAPCAILDILGPPYSIEEDRDCTYYTDIPYTHYSSKYHRNLNTFSIHTRSFGQMYCCCLFGIVCIRDCPFERHVMT